MRQSLSTRFDALPSTVEAGVTALLQKEAMAFNNRARIINELRASSEFDQLEAFRVIDMESSGSLDLYNVAKFMRLNNMMLTDREILAFLRKVGKDNRANYDDIKRLLMVPPVWREADPGFKTVETTVSHPSPRVTKVTTTTTVYNPPLLDSISSSPRRQLQQPRYLSPTKSSLAQPDPSYMSYVRAVPKNDLDTRYSSPSRSLNYAFATPDRNSRADRCTFYSSPVR